MMRLFSLLLILNQPLSAKADSPHSASSLLRQNCQQTFIGKLKYQKKIYSQWPVITNKKSPLPQDTRERILSHPKIKELKELYKAGKHITFDFDYIGPDHIYRGEYIQRVFLIKIIKLIFPSAKIIVRGYNDRFPMHKKVDKLSKAHVVLKVVDVRETDWWQKRFSSDKDLDNYLSNNKSVIDMVLLKTANSSHKNIPENYKSRFPSFEKDTVLSLYLPEDKMNYPDTFLYLQNKEKTDIFDILDSSINRGFRKFFLTSHFKYWPQEKEKEAQFLSKFSDRFDKVFFLSSLSTTKLNQIQPHEKVIFFNDITGYTPVLHSLADVAFIWGPINMLEGIFLNAKVIFMGNEANIPEKYKSAFKQLKKTALKTNRAVHIKSFNEIEKALKVLEKLSSKPVVYPDEVVVDPLNGDALNQLLERLYFQITESARLIKQNHFKLHF